MGKKGGAIEAKHQDSFVSRWRETYSYDDILFCCETLPEEMVCSWEDI
jgi:hypothetical protein